MNQIKKRLSIIDLAISITDNETIELQVLKLKLLKIDLRVDNIIALLQSENYAQAQALISQYTDIETPKAIPQPSPKPIPIDEDQAIIDEFQLFVSPTKRIRASTKRQEEIEIDDFTPPIENKKVESQKIIETPKEEITEPKEESKPKVTNIDIDNLLKIEPHIEPKAEEKLKIKSQSQPTNEVIHKYKKVEDTDDGFFNIEDNKQPILDQSIIPKDTFFDNHKQTEETTPPTIIEPKEIIPATKPPLRVDNIKDEIKEEAQKEEAEKELKEEKKSKDKLTYEAIPHIGEKLLSMRKQYLSTDKSYEKFSTVEALLTQISQKGYTEKEIEETLFYIKKFVGNKRYSEAAQLLLVCAATESKFAHLMLARELYKGEILNKNISEAFLIINNLANNNNAEALCDLGQFYENGIGVTKDKKKAESLYTESMELGIKRAKTHYKRVKKENRSFFRRG